MNFNIFNLTLTSFALIFGIFLMITGFSGGLSSVVGGGGWLVACLCYIGIIVNTITKMNKENKKEE